MRPEAEKRYSTGLPKVSHEEFRKIKEVTGELFLCAYAPLTEMGGFSNRSWGYALFDKDCCLLRLFGHPDYLEECRRRGIERGTLWTGDRIGFNAIGEGIEQNRLTVSEAAQHQVAALQDVTVYFSPVFCDLHKIKIDYRSVRPVSGKEPGRDSTGPDTMGVFGGVAVLSFGICDSERFVPLAEACAREISLQLIWFNNSFRDVSDDTGRIAIDQSRGGNQITILTTNIYRFFKLRNNTSYRLKPLENIIDGLPKNKEFWDIVYSGKFVHAHNLTLTVRKETLDVSITTYGGIEERFHMKEFIIDFQFRQKIDNLLNQYAGNTVHFTFDNIICRAPVFRETLEYARTASTSDSNILLLGESGAGKDVVAQSIHNASKRSKKPFVVINCAVFSKELIASELFGYEAGAFTGAKKTGAIGKFEMANHGTLFLDEIGDMPLDLQAHLLRAIEQKSFTKVGGSREIHADVRILAATNIDLIARVREKLFREDLFYRLSVINIRIPPLRERKEDILPMAEYFLGNVAMRYDRPVPVLAQGAKELLMEYPWPGNVRELQNLIEGVISVSSDALIQIDTDHVLRFMKQSYIDRDSVKGKTNDVPEEQSGQQVRRRNRKLVIGPGYMAPDDVIAALEANGYSVEKAAQQLGVSRRTLYRRLDEFGLLR